MIKHIFEMKEGKVILAGTPPMTSRHTLDQQIDPETKKPLYEIKPGLIVKYGSGNDTLRISNYLEPAYGWLLDADGTVARGTGFVVAGYLAKGATVRVGERLISAGSGMIMPSGPIIQKRQPGMMGEVIDPFIVGYSESAVLAPQDGPIRIGIRSLI